MKNQYQIDQSGKIEQTNKPTVVALANGEVMTVKISAVEKQKLIKTIIELRRPHKTYKYDIFSALVFILLIQVYPVKVEIDKEYPGHEAGIKERIIQFFERMNKEPPEINFGLVGKKCQAHIRGLAVYKGKEKTNILVNSKDIISILYLKPNKKGWRPQSSRGNP
jgi:hypothetical protein